MALASRIQSQPVDFLIEYRSARSFLISSDSESLAMPTAAGKEPEHGMKWRDTGTDQRRFRVSTRSSGSKQRVNAPKWTKWEDKQIETSIGDMRQLSNETMISYSILNSSNQPDRDCSAADPDHGAQGHKEEKEGRQRHHLGSAGDSRLQVEHNAA